MKPQQAGQTLDKLQALSLEQLQSEYPDEWTTVQGDLSAIFERGKMEELETYLKELSTLSSAPTKVLHAQSGRKKALEDVLSQAIRARMAQLAIKAFCLAASTGAKGGKLRFSLLNGFIIQKLLFAEALERKPVSMFWFNLLWPFIGQKELLMPLVQPKGIFCFYSRALIDRLTALIGNRSCLEIAAGDGTLARFLRSRGVQITVTDDYSWQNRITFPTEVINLEAREALSRYSPEVVLCSWPPANNPFERQVFRTRSVQLYLVIGSRHEFAAGNWKDYRQQTTFSFEEDKELSALVLPPELESAVYLFRRNATPAAQP